MARYNREFLVPYLQNICALQLSIYKAKRSVSVIRDDLNKQKKLAKDGGVSFPREPELEPTVSCLGVLSMAYGVFCILLSVAGLVVGALEDIENGVFTFAIVCCILSFLIFFGIPFGAMMSEKKRNKEAREEYQERVIWTQVEFEKNVAAAKAVIPGIETRLSKTTREISKMEQVLGQMYAANIIPIHYRDVYASVYLAEWFSTGGSDDLDHALSMYVLEEIKSRLDTVIYQQSEMLINQQVMIANQYKTMELQQNYYSKMMDKLASIEASSEEQTRYMGMIEGNTAAIAYFSTMDYYTK